MKHFQLLSFVFELYMLWQKDHVPASLPFSFIKISAKSKILSNFLCLFQCWKSKIEHFYFWLIYNSFNLWRWRRNVEVRSHQMYFIGLKIDKNVHQHLFHIEWSHFLHYSDIYWHKTENLFMSRKIENVHLCTGARIKL